MSENFMVQNNGGFEFQVPEFNTQTRSIWWYLFIFIFFAGLLITSIRTHQLSLAFLVVLGAIVYYEITLVDPKKINITFSKLGISYKKMFYPWQMFKSFAVFGEGENQVIHIDKLSFASGPLVIALPEKSDIKYNNKNVSNQIMFLTIIRHYLPEKFHAKMNLADWLNILFKV